MSAPPRILGEKYQLIRPLEQGGMGSVWLAEHLSLALFEQPEGLAQVVAEVAPLRPSSSGVAQPRALASASVVPRKEPVAAPLASATEAPQVAAPDGAAVSRGAVSRAVPSRAPVSSKAVSRAASSNKAGASLTITSTPLSHVLIDGAPRARRRCTRCGYALESTG